MCRGNNLAARSLLRFLVSHKFIQAVDTAARPLILARTACCTGALPIMPTSRFEPSSIKNKIKREEIANKQKREKRQDKLKRRLAQAKAEANDPLAKKVCS